ncbi:MAG: class I SAM-dependent methyltransferase [Thermoguttaceae bacterium]
MFKKDICSADVSNTVHHSEANKAAWERLYAGTEDLVWGTDALEFVSESLNWLGQQDLLQPHPRILDAATGEGRNLPALLKVSERVTACDASVTALNKLHTRFGDQVDVVECDLAQTPFPSFHFDCILACDIMETLPNLEEVLREMARVLRIGGVLLCNVPNFDDGISGEDMEPLPNGGFLYQGDYFFRFQSEASFLDILRRCGFQKVYSNTATWTEYAHPGFRDGEHSHTSRIIIALRIL